MRRLIFLLFLTIAILFLNFAYAQGASLYLEAPSGKFTVNGTFTIALYVDTDGIPINAIEADLKFPSDKLQVVSPTTNTSFFKVWLGIPAYSNSEGTINLKGGVPSPGIITSKGLVTTITFRAKSTGQAQIVFTDESKVLADDGQATDVLSQKKGVVISLTLPPPAGPIISSPTHPDQNQWYFNNNPIFVWNKESDVTGFSYVLDREPITVPDDAIDSVSPRIKIKNIEDDIFFFHVKAYSSDGTWGGVSHYQILVDKTPPAKFPIEIE
ncbi:MAG: cohesin domain-containing protein, partial [Patescibacteria group bacterium]